ncbi:MAG: TonB-dependent receptor [Pseudomonadota bacterium]
MPDREKYAPICAGAPAVIPFGAVCLLCAASAVGQTPGPAGGPAQEPVEEIVVTGSRIVRRDFSSPSPISTIDRAVLDSAAQPTLEEILNQMPQVVPDLGRTSNNPGDGTARINLRGLGSNRTLVLLNGRRLAPSGVDTAVDVNNLPQSLISHVEIITGGATTVYGSDAVAGVVNFVTRDDVDGLQIDATAYTTEQGDGNIYDLNVSYGHDFADGKGNATVYAGYYDRSSVFASERRLTAIPIQDTDGMLTPAGSLATPSSVVTFPLVDFGNGAARTTFDTGGLPVEFIDPDDRYNFAPLNYLQVPLVRSSAGMFLAYDIGAGSEIYAELSYTRNESRQNLAPVPVNNLVFTNLDNPELAAETQQFFQSNFAPPFLPPGTAGFFLSRRLEELGARVFDRQRDYARLVTGLRGEFGERWDYDVWLSYTKNDEDTLLRNGASAARFQQGLFVDAVSGQCVDSSDGCVPLNVWGAGNLSPAGADFVRLPALENTTSREQRLISGYVTGSPFESWAGPVQVAAGAEWRSDDGSFRADEALSSGDALGYRGSAGVDGSESVYEVFAEAVVPLAADAVFVRYLGLELGARYSDYENAGSVDTYKVGGEWRPLEILKVRAMYQRSVRAPNLAEAFQERFTETFAYVGSNPAEDPCSLSADPVGNGNVDACVATGLPADQIGLFEATVGVPTDFVQGGNPDLAPEVADTFTLGFVVDLGQSGPWRLSVDYFDLEIEGTIGDLEATVACFDPANDQNLFCDRFVRDPVNYNIVQLTETKVNRGVQQTSGFDTQLGFGTTLGEWAQIGASEASLSADLVWTHTLKNTISELSFGTRLDCAGQFGFQCSTAADGLTYPEDRIFANVLYASGPIEANLNWCWIGGTDNAALLLPGFLGAPVPDLVIEDIGSASYLDLGIGYAFSDRVRARLNISNLLDRSPPLMADAVTSNNTDTRTFDIFGRSYSLVVSLRY